MPPNRRESRPRWNWPTPLFETTAQASRRIAQSRVARGSVAPSAAERILIRVGQRHDEIIEELRKTPEFFGRDRLELRPLTQSDLRNLPDVIARLSRKSNHGLPSYGNSIGYLMQASRHMDNPWIAKINGGKDGVFLISTRQRESPPFLILSPQGPNSRKLSLYVQAIAQRLADESGEKVILKKPELELELQLRKHGFGDYREGDRVPAPKHDDDSFQNHVIVLDDLVAGHKRIETFRKSLPRGYRAEVVEYHPDEKIELAPGHAVPMQQAAQSLLDHWTSHLTVRTGENEETAKAAHRMYLRQHSTLPFLAGFLVFLHNPSSQVRIPLGFSMFDHIGEYRHVNLPNVAALIPRRIPARPRPKSKQERREQDATLSPEELKRNLIAGLYYRFGPSRQKISEPLRSFNLRAGPRANYAMIANVADTGLVVEGKPVAYPGEALLYYSMKHLRSQRNFLKRAMVHLGGSETESLDQFKRKVSRSVGSVSAKHLVLYPRAWKPPA